MTETKRPARGKITPPAATMKHPPQRPRGSRRHVRAPLQLDTRVIIILIVLAVVLTGGSMLLPHQWFRLVNFPDKERVPSE